jgi:adenosylcobinamide amidohydrolase
MLVAPKSSLATGLEEIHLADGVKLVVRENVLAVISQRPLKTISSAIFNGGEKQVKAVLNIGVPEGYSDHSLHIDPMQLITSSAAKVNVTHDYLAMVTAAKMKNYALFQEKTPDFSVTVAATAGCSHGESSGEEMNVQEIAGTINIIVFIDGNPTDSCMVAALITATEAKSAALRHFDVRSRYNGDSATGSITDSATVASICSGKTLTLAGPASKVGKLVGACTRKAVVQALITQEPMWECRTVLYRLKERHLPLEKLAYEVSKIGGLYVTPERLGEIIRGSQSAAIALLAASKLDDDYHQNLLPGDFDNWCQAIEGFSEFIENKVDPSKLVNYDKVDLPPFIKQALVVIVSNSI